MAREIPALLIDWPSSGAAWLRMRQASLAELIEVATRPGFGILEEEARSQLRTDLHAAIQEKNRNGA